MEHQTLSKILVSFLAADSDLSPACPSLSQVETKLTLSVCCCGGLPCRTAEPAQLRDKFEQQYYHGTDLLLWFVCCLYVSLFIETKLRGRPFSLYSSLFL